MILLTEYFQKGANYKINKQKRCEKILKLIKFDY